MRKVLSLILVAVTVVSMALFTACETEKNTSTPTAEVTTTPSTGETTTTPTSTPTPTPTPTPTEAPGILPEQLAKALSDAINKTLALESIDSKVENSYTENQDGLTYSEGSTVNLKVEDKTAENVVFAADGYEMTFGEKIPMYVAFIDGYVYMSEGGIKMKLTLDEMIMMGMIEEGEDPLKAMTQSDTDAFIALPAEVLGGVNGKPNDDGSLTYEISLSDEQFKKCYESYVESLIEQIAYGSEVESYSFTESKVIITVDSDGYVVYYSIENKLNISYDTYGDGEFVESNVTSVNKLTINNPGKTVKVTPPEDIDSYMGMYEMYLEQLRAMDWKEYGAELLNWEASNWEEFLTVNQIPEESFADVMAIVTWEDFKAAVLEDINI